MSYGNATGQSGAVNLQGAVKKNPKPCKPDDHADHNVCPDVQQSQRRLIEVREIETQEPAGGGVLIQKLFCRGIYGSQIYAEKAHHIEGFEKDEQIESAQDRLKYSCNILQRHTDFLRD